MRSVHPLNLCLGSLHVSELVLVIFLHALRLALQLLVLLILGKQFLIVLLIKVLQLALMPSRIHIQNMSVQA